MTKVIHKTLWTIGFLAVTSTSMIALFVVCDFILGGDLR
jgi:hypothetical protein